MPARSVVSHVGQGGVPKVMVRDVAGFVVGKALPRLALTAPASCSTPPWSNSLGQRGLVGTSSPFLSGFRRVTRSEGTAPSAKRGSRRQSRYPPCSLRVGTRAPSRGTLRSDPHGTCGFLPPCALHAGTRMRHARPEHRLHPYAGRMYKGRIPSVAPASVPRCFAFCVHHATAVRCPMEAGSIGPGECAAQRPACKSISC